MAVFLSNQRELEAKISTQRVWRGGKISRRDIAVYTSWTASAVAGHAIGERERAARLAAGSFRRGRVAADRIVLSAPTSKEKGKWPNW
jgi:hypothetical protein